jgi:hypothetical protein
MLVAENDGDVAELLRLVLVLWAGRKEVRDPKQEEAWVGQ